MSRSGFFWLSLLLLPLIAGCEGCRPTTPTTNTSEEDKKAPKEAYTTGPVIAFPADQSETIGSVKPGHWTTAEQSIRSNKSDTRGSLTSKSSLTLRDVNMQKTGVVQSMETIRPVVLPKGQMRGFDFRFRCPVPNSIDIRRIGLASRLIPRSGGIMDTGGVPFNVMKGSEYFFVVLTNRPERFARLQVANWVRSSEDQIRNPRGDANYRVVIPDAADLISLPETMLDMTSIAVILWDDLSEDALTPFQRTALVDWIRFGGRLIVNGPDASDAFSNTPMGDLLPLTPTSNIELDAEAAIELLEAHSVQSDRSLEKQIQFVRAESSRIALDGRLNPGAQAIENTASLILERRVGRGHIVQPRFDLTDNWIEAWDSYDSFVNGVILDRPPRKYLKPTFAFDEEDEVADQGYDARDLRLFFTGTTIRSDAAVNTRLRILARDSLLVNNEEEASRSNSPFDSHTKVDAITGISAWNDSSDCIKNLRQTLSGEAGIEIPDSSLVLRSLAIYLIVLVPINYVVFRLMNRLEYAWFAVPVIAIIGAVYAARQARLDIGFARSNTELAILESHEGYRRGHLTRVIGVYNSLSDRYELQFSTVDGIAAPLEGEPDPNTPVQPYFKNSYEEGPSLADLAVNSNRMRYVHTEQMVDLGGSVLFDGKEKITNESDIEFLDCICVRKDANGESEVSIVGSISPGEQKTVEFKETDRLMVSDELPMRAGELIRRLASPKSMPADSCRLLGRIDGRLEGLEITPSASQYSAQTIAVIHFKHPDLPDAKPDSNLVGDFRRVNRLDSKKGDGDGDSAETTNDDETTEAIEPVESKTSQ